MSKQRKILSISDEYLTFLQAKEGGAPLFRQVIIKGLKDEEIVKKVLSLVKEFQITRQQMIAVINRQNILVRFMTLPSNNLIELKNMVALQVSNIIPYAAEDISFDVQLVEDIGGGQSKVMIVIVPKEIINRQWHIYTKAGVSPAVMSASSIGVWLWYNRRQLDRAGIALILDINELEAEICICNHEHLFFSRALRFPALDLSADAFKSVLKEIDLTIDGYVQERIGPLPSKIIITGSKPIPIDLLGALNKAYDLPVEDVDHARNIKGCMESATALIGFSSTELVNTINLIPKELVDLFLRDQTKKALRRLFGAIFLFVLIAVVVGVLHVYRKNVQLEDLNRQWVQTKRQLDIIESTKSKIDAMSQELNNRVVLSDVFKVMLESVPPGVSLFNLSLSDKVLSMQGVAAKQADISAFQEGLMRSALFTNVRLDFVNKRATQDSEVSYFKISCQMK